MIGGTAKKYIKKLSNQSMITSTDFTFLSNMSNTLIQNSNLATSSISNVVKFQTSESSGSESNSRSDAIQGSSIPEQIPMQFSSQFELPKLSTPIFYGALDTRLAFYDSFRSMCHDNSRIPTIHKFIYLVTS